MMNDPAKVLMDYVLGTLPKPAAHLPDVRAEERRAGIRRQIRLCISAVIADLAWAAANDDIHAPYMRSALKQLEVGLALAKELDTPQESTGKKWPNDD